MILYNLAIRFDDKELNGSLGVAKRSKSKELERVGRKSDHGKKGHRTSNLDRRLG